VIGMISSIPLDGAMPAMMRMGAQPTPPQMVMEQIREFFEVKTLEKDVKEIPADVDVLMLVQPRGLTPDATYAIDQFALAAARCWCSSIRWPSRPQRGNPMGMPGHAARHRADGEAAEAWGVAYDPKKIATDIAYARRVQFGGGRSSSVTDYVAWLSLDRNALDQRDVLSGGIERLNLATPAASRRRRAPPPR
jgi:ABC-type uncharacterized transport system involved in gliding motility auxiliary subunit